MNAGNALKLACVGIAGGIIFRFAGLLFLFDFTTGFYTDNGLAAWGAMAFLVVVAAVAIIWCKRDKRAYFGPYETRKNNGAGVVSVLAALTLLVISVTETQTHMQYRDMENISRNHSQSNTVHLLFIASSIAFAILLIMTAIGFFTGKNLFQKVPVLTLLSVVWGIMNLLFIFFYYAKSAMRIENVYMIAGGSSMLLSLLYISKLIVGQGGEKTAKNCYITGIPAILINLTYTVSNLMMSLLGRNYYGYGEIPIAIQIGSLSISLYILVFLFTFKKYSLKRKPRPAPGEREALKKHGGKRFSV